jgi:hypothetical protein
MRRSGWFVVPVVALVIGMAACGDADDSGGGGGGGGTGGGGSSSTTDPGMRAGAPSFTSFELAESSVPCDGGNATVHMSFETVNVASIEIKIGDGGFESTAGYGPNESDVVAEIPCSGATSSSIQLKGCTEDDECAESEVQDVTVTG